MLKIVVLFFFTIFFQYSLINGERERDTERERERLLTQKFQMVMILLFTLVS